MNRAEVENGIQAMADVGTVLLMMDRAFIGRLPEPEHMERAFYILENIFERRYTALRAAYYGGESHA